ncbi:hypothetical protein [Candidatus Manganitrophus noduliformans]|uniref:Uncharacterized protein n=1 Tax=Candidatus Manganitrophus noduliformans TaxID=2606439 RepID=A0A7X6IBY5_9BACT|nr:hypothetical protein [Candidatus Manganitrophus noduliformans]NKE71991.1 hypothetical protein [Candidatus Manganitrophus noduliformans]
MKQQFVFALLFFLFFPVQPVLAKTLALSGVPEIQTKSTLEESIRIEMDSVKKRNHRVVVIKDGDAYYWETRERRKLIRSTQGPLTLFIDPTGGGYIKVISSEGKVLYMEHHSQGLNTFTYWGVVEHFEP